MQDIHRFSLFSLFKVITQLILYLGAMFLPVSSFGQTSAHELAWFGLALPPAFQPHSVPVIIGDRGPVPALVPEGEQSHKDLTGQRIQGDLETIVGFSRNSREQREVGEASKDQINP